MSRNYVIAGGSKGIGLQIARQLESTASQICVYSRNQDDLTINAVVSHSEADFTDENLELVNLPEVIHGVAYCPGTINLRSFRSLKPQDFLNDFQTNLLGAVRFLQACLPGLKRGAESETSSVVLFSTVAVNQGMPMHSSIAASKGAVEGLVRSLAAEWSPDIRVNGLSPALTDTPLASRFLSTPEKREAMASRYPLGRTGTATDIATLACLLLQPESNWITGQIIGVDGGLSSLRI